MHRTLLCVVCLLAVTVGTHATEPNLIDITQDSLAGDYATCAAYFRLVSQGMAASAAPEGAAAYREAEDTSMFYSLLLANEGRTNDMAVKVTNARIEMNLKVMKEEVDNRNENIAILASRHSETCKHLVESPPPRAQEAMDRQIKEVSP